MNRDQVRSIRDQLAQLRLERDRALTIIQRCRQNRWAVPSNLLEICAEFDERRQALERRLIVARLERHVA